MALPKPNYTQIPNLFFDAMPSMKDAELRILLAVARQTFGYHRESDYLSITALCKLTGLSRRGVSHGIADAVDRGWLSQIGIGKRGMKRWKLSLYNEVPQSEEATIAQSAIVPVHEVVQTTPSTIARGSTTKESIKEKVKKDTPDGVAVAALIKAWIDASGAIVANPYGNKGYRAVAKAMHEAGITPDDVTCYIAFAKRDKFYANKAVAIGTVSMNIAAWKKLHPPAPAPTPAPDEPAPKPSIYGGYYLPPKDEAAS